MNCQVIFRERRGLVAPYRCGGPTVGEFTIACVHEHITKGWMCQRCVDSPPGCHLCRDGSDPHRCVMAVHDLPGSVTDLTKDDTHG